MTEEKKEWPKPSLTADVLAFTLVDGELAVLLIRRGRDPFEGMWALPGGFCEPGETIAAAAARELEEETRVVGLALEELHTLSTPGRDPRGWVVGVAHLAFLPPERIGDARGGDDASDAAFFRLSRGGGAGALRLRRGPHPVDEELHALAFDHVEELELALGRLRREPNRFAPALLGASFDVAAFGRTCRALALGEAPAGAEARWLARAGEDGHVAAHDGALRAGPRAFGVVGP